MASEGAQATAGISAWLVRALLVVASGLFLWWGSQQWAAFLQQSTVNFRLEVPLFWWSVALFALAGLSFGLATRFPFPRPRFAFGRLLFAAVALTPAFHLWQGWNPGEPLVDFLGGVYWFDEPIVVMAGAILAGVAIASGVGARRERR